MNPHWAQCLHIDIYCMTIFKMMWVLAGTNAIPPVPFKVDTLEIWFVHALVSNWWWWWWWWRRRGRLGGGEKHQLIHTVQWQRGLRTKSDQEERPCSATVILPALKLHRGSKELPNLNRLYRVLHWGIVPMSSTHTVQDISTRKSNTLCYQ